MLKIYPEVDFKETCPLDNDKLEVRRVVIPGMRCMAETVCPTCETEYYVDLPVAHAIKNQHFLNAKTGEIVKQNNSNWLTNNLKQNFSNPVIDEVVPIVHKFWDAERIIILNCLDFLYGHSLLKLLNVQRYLDHYPDLGCCVLVPKQLVHLVPDGVAEIWEFPVSIKEGGKWYPSLQNWIEKQITQRKECFLSRAYSHPSNKVYDLDRFARNFPDISNEVAPYQPIILWNHREDRLWGKSLQHQQRNIQKLYQRLSDVFPDLALVLVGFGQQMKIEETDGKVIDLRTDQFDVERDQLWMAYMKVADCAVGVHGSNMLLSSGLAKSTIELVARSRFGNIFQATLFSPEFSDIRDAFLKYRYCYGDNQLTDVSTQQIFDLIISLIAFQERSSHWFKVGEAETSDRVFQPSQLSETALTAYRQPPYPVGLKNRVKAKLQKILQEGIHRLDTI